MFATINHNAADLPETVAEEANSWVERIARFGYFAKGAVYATLGILTAQAALGVRGTPDGTQGVLVHILQQPFGQLLLAITAVGLVGYVIWRFVQAFVDPEDKGTDAVGLAQRCAYVLSGLAYGTLAYTAGSMIIGVRYSTNGNAPEDWTARALGLPYGRWLVGLAGLAVVGVGVAYFSMGYTVAFREWLKTEAMRDGAGPWIVRSGRIGYMSRGIVYCVVGLLVLRAALRFNPQHAGGVGDALRMLARQPYGAWALAAIAVGLVSYGLYAMLEARYRRIYVR
jgi:hypothetical protein